MENSDWRRCFRAGRAHHGQLAQRTTNFEENGDRAFVDGARWRIFPHFRDDARADGVGSSRFDESVNLRGRRCQSAAQVPICTVRFARSPGGRNVTPCPRQVASLVVSPGPVLWFWFPTRHTVVILSFSAPCATVQPQNPNGILCSTTINFFHVGKTRFKIHLNSCSDKPLEVMLLFPWTSLICVSSPKCVCMCVKRCPFPNTKCVCMCVTKCVYMCVTKCVC